MNKIAARFLTILMILSLGAGFFCACGAKPEDDPSGPAPTETPGGGDAAQAELPGEKLNIGLVITNLGDNSISDQLYNGMRLAQEKWGFHMDYTECESSDMPAVMTEYTESEEYDLIVLLSYHALDAANAMQEQYPEQKYLVYDVAAPGNPNMMSESFAKNQLGFVAGVFAALMDAKGEAVINGESHTWTPSGKYGAMIGMELTSTVGAITGFYAGVHYIDPGAEIQYTTVGSWTDQATAKELALTMYGNGVNILFHNAGGAFLGAVEAAKTVDGFAIGYDANQNEMEPTHILGSSHKLNSEVVVRFFDDFVNGRWNGGTDIVNGYHNEGAAFSYQEGLEVPEDVKAVMDEVITAIQNGEITPPSTWEELETFTMTRG